MVLIFGIKFQLFDFECDGNVALIGYCIEIILAGTIMVNTGFLS